MIRYLVGLWLAVLVAVSPAHAQHFPENHGSPVVDQANLLSPEQELDLKSKSETLYAQTGRAFAVATVNSLDDLTVEEYANRLFRKWGIGGEQRDDGVLLLVAPRDHKVRIEPGYGAEAYVTDIVSGRIIRDTIVPYFRKTPPDYGGGITAGADQIISLMQLPAEEAAARAQEIGTAESRRSENRVNPFPVVFIVIIFFVIIGSISSRAGGRRYRRRDSGISPWIVLWGLNELSRGSRGGWGGGGSWGGGGWGGGGGGGFGGFGGGSSGGGGASGSW